MAVDPGVGFLSPVRVGIFVVTRLWSLGKIFDERAAASRWFGSIMAVLTDEQSSSVNLAELMAGMPEGGDRMAVMEAWQDLASVDCFIKTLEDTSFVGSQRLASEGVKYPLNAKSILGKFCRRVAQCCERIDIGELVRIQEQFVAEIGPQPATAYESIFGDVCAAMKPGTDCSGAPEKRQPKIEQGTVMSIEDVHRIWDLPGDNGQYYKALNSMAVMYACNGNLELSVETCEQVITLARRNNDDKMVDSALDWLCSVCQSYGLEFPGSVGTIAQVVKHLGDSRVVSAGRVTEIELLEVLRTGTDGPRIVQLLGRCFQQFPGYQCGNSEYEAAFHSLQAYTWNRFGKGELVEAHFAIIRQLVGQLPLALAYTYKAVLALAIGTWQGEISLALELMSDPAPEKWHPEWHPVKHLLKAWKLVNERQWAVAAEVLAGIRDVSVPVAVFIDRELSILELNILICRKDFQLAISRASELAAREKDCYCAATYQLLGVRAMIASDNIERARETLADLLPRISFYPPLAVECQLYLAEIGLEEADYENTYGLLEAVRQPVIVTKRAILIARYFVLLARCVKATGDVDPYGETGLNDSALRSFKRHCSSPEFSEYLDKIEQIERQFSLPETFASSEARKRRSSRDMRSPHKRR